MSIGYEYKTCNQIVWEVQMAVLQGFDVDISDIGGWSLDVHHHYNFHEGKWEFVKIKTRSNIRSDSSNYDDNPYGFSTLAVRPVKTNIIQQKRVGFQESYKKATAQYCTSNINIRTRYTSWPAQVCKDRWTVKTVTALPKTQDCCRP